MPAKERLKLGLITDTLQLPAWQYLIVDSILKTGDAIIELVVVRDAAGLNTETSDRGFLFNAFEEHDDKKQRIEPDAFAARDAQLLLAGCTTLTLPSAAPWPPSHAADPVVDQIRNWQLDVILDLNSGHVASWPTDISKYGVWFYRHGRRHYEDNRGRTAGIQEVLNHEPCLYSALVCDHVGGQPETELYSSHSAVHHVSFVRTRNEHLWKCAGFVGRKLRDVSRRGIEGMAHSARTETLGERQLLQSRTASARNSALAMPLLRYLSWRVARKFRRRQSFDQWAMMTDLTGAGGDFSKYRILAPSPDKFWADPHVIRRNGKYYVFFEELPYSTNRGHISVLEMDDDGEYQQAVTVLKRPYHLSYPFILEWEGDLFMIPESEENRTIEAYRCVSFPDRWEFECNLMQDIRALDATLLKHGGKWWMFANVVENSGASTWDELCLFHADHPLSTHWTPHPMNPIISDVRSARPAGRLYTDGDQLIRPSQDCSNRYGYGLNLSRVIELTTSNYKEEIIQRYRPDWDPHMQGLHTINRAGNLTIIDVLYNRSRRR